MESLCAAQPQFKRLSWSRLKAFKACKRQAHLLTAGKKSPLVDIRAFLPGKIADLAMRQWLEEGQFNPGGMRALVPEIFESAIAPEAEGVVRWKGNVVDDQKAVLQTIYEAVDALEPILFEKVVPYDFRPEFRVNAPITIPGLDGEPIVVELMLAADVAVCRGEYWYGIYDLKLTRGGGYIDSTLGQLIFYDLVFRAWTGFYPKEHEFWAPLLPEKIIPLHVTPEDRQYMVADIVECFHGIWRGEADLTDDDRTCYFCPVKHACPKFVTPITKDAQGKNRVSFSRR